MIIRIDQIGPEGRTFEGEESGTILELEKDHFAHADGAILYQFEVRVVTSELIVSGSLRAPMKLLCRRCGGFFSTTLEVSSFLRAYELAECGESVDLTPEIREDVLLLLPTFPACAWAAESGVCPHSGLNLDELRRAEKPSDDGRWAGLENLDVT